MQHSARFNDSNVTVGLQAINNLVREKQPSFDIPERLATGSLVATLSGHAPLRVDPVRSVRLRFLDTFDWRLFERGFALESEENGDLRLRWWTWDGETLLGFQPCAQRPRFARDMSPGRVRDALAPVLEMRALLPVARLRARQRPLRIVNEEEKTVLRLILTEYRVLAGHGKRAKLRFRRLRLRPVRGYNSVFKQMHALLSETLSLPAADHSVLSRALAAIGRSPGDYSSKLALTLDPQVRADTAARAILRNLADTVQANEDGVRRDLDSEFLHDLRVAVRRTRSALAQVKGVLPQKTVDRFRSEFGWLGASTNHARDMDVYLLAFDEYKASLPAAMQAHLAPLHAFLASHRLAEYRKLARLLTSARYLRLMRTWRAFLDREPPGHPKAPNALRPVLEVAGKRIWKTFRRAMRQGRAIGPDSPAMALHELRITCKKLRYLMEFFRSLYPEQRIGALIKVLKGFQDNLGEHQDLSVQQESLRGFAAGMAEEGALAPETAKAMELLVEHLRGRQAAVRQEFSGRFASFSAPEVKAEFKDLFKPSGEPEPASP